MQVACEHHHGCTGEVGWGEEAKLVDTDPVDISASYLEHPAGVEDVQPDHEVQLVS